jgi:hypothetical protein
MKKLFFYLVFAICAIAAFGKNSLVLAPLLNDGGIEEGRIRMLTRLLENAIQRTRKFDIIDRGAVGDILKEHDFQLSDLSDDRKTVELGKILNANFLMRPSVMPLAGDLFLESRIVEVNTGRMINSAEVRIKADLSDAYEKLGELVSALTGTAPARNASRKPRPPREPKQREPVEAAAALGIGASFLTSGGTAGLDLGTAEIHFGINLQSSSNFFLNILGDAGAGLGVDFGSYYCGGSVEILVLKYFLPGAGGGMAGANDSSSGNAIIPFSPYIRGSLAFRLFPDDFDQMSIKAFYDYKFDYGYRLGVVFNFFIFFK